MTPHKRAVNTLEFSTFNLCNLHFSYSSYQAILNLLAELI